MDSKCEVLDDDLTDPMKAWIAGYKKGVELTEKSLQKTFCLHCGKLLGSQFSTKNLDKF